MFLIMRDSDSRNPIAKRMRGHAGVRPANAARGKALKSRD